MEGTHTAHDVFCFRYTVPPTLQQHCDKRRLASNGQRVRYSKRRGTAADRLLEVWDCNVTDLDL